jgi:hypothetical protein
VPQRKAKPRWWIQLLVLAWLGGLYDLVNNLAPTRIGAAMAHGFADLHVEQSLGWVPELAVNHWLAGHPLLGLLAGDYYDCAHFAVTLVVFAWLWWRHPDFYRPLRDALVAVSVVGFAVYWFFPAAPPRLLPGAGFSDIVSSTHAIGAWRSGVLAHTANQFAAMPSLHLAWALWVAFALWRVHRHARAAIALVWAYPLLTTLAVIATGNHLLIDCVAGAVTLALCLAAVLAFHGRRRSRVDHQADPESCAPRPHPQRERVPVLGAARAVLGRRMT